MAAFEAIHAIYLVSSSKPELTDKSGDGLAQTLSSITLGHLEVGWGVGLLAIGAMLCLLGPLVGKKSGVPS